MSSESDQLAAQSAQRTIAQRATMDLFRAKAPAQDEFETTVPTSEGPQQASVLFRAMGGRDYDALIDLHPPTEEQKTKNPNSNFNPHTFAPALLSQVCVEPSLTPSEWRELYTDPKWNAGELNDLFWRAVALCSKGLDINPIGRASA